MNKTEITSPKITEGDTLNCVNSKNLPGNMVAPPLEEGAEYPALKVIACSCGKQHIDVGLKSEYNWVSCYNCKEILPESDQIHYCHPSRFEIKK